MHPLNVFLWMGFRTLPCVSLDGGLGPTIVHVPSPCVSMDGGLGPPIVYVPSPCISMGGV